MSLFALVLLTLGQAFATVDPACADVAAEGPPDDYSEQGQQDYMLNFFALATTYSPLHAPVPYEPGHGSMGLELSMIPPLSCERRLVLNYTKTEDTNKAPILPRLRVMWAFPKLGKVIPYASVAYVPPVTVFGTRNTIMSGELGFGVKGEKPFSWGGRYHATTLKTVAEIAGPFEESDPVYNDLYLGSTFGFDLLFGLDFKGLEPYLAVGFTDVSTFFYIGDDGVVTNNGTPYAGLTNSLGLEYKRIKHLDLAAEYYGAPYNFKRENDVTGEETSPGAHIHTVRTRVAYRW